MFNWDALLSEKRLIRSEAGELTFYCRAEEAPRTAAEADVQRIIFSSPFRRLAGKTQVHPFARVDYVHNRLTHSLEVAETGHGLAQRVMRDLGLSPAHQHAGALHVRAACLGHDIGNPPYGHVGEEVIQSWGWDREADLRTFFRDGGESEEIAEAIIRDIQLFDGNAQTFRLLSHPMPRDGAHFRLTCATLGTVIKYPCTSQQATRRKYSIFSTAQETVTFIHQELGLSSETRHPLSYVVEIADDICYCVTDCEDALLMDILDAKTVQSWFLELFSNPNEAAGYAALSIAHLRAKVIHHLLTSFAAELTEAFRNPASLQNFEATSPTWSRLKRLKQKYQIVFDDEQKLEKEAHIRRDFRETLDHFFETLILSGQSQLTAAEVARIHAVFGETFTADSRAMRPSEKIHLLLDGVTGMSDASLRAFIRNR